jgi:transcriptional regulator with XRE-family HTH domain
MTSPVTPARTLIPRTADLHRRLVARLSAAAPDLPDRLARPNLPAVREAVALFHACFVELGRASGIDASAATARALPGGFDGLMALRARHFGEAAKSLLDCWLGQGIVVERAAAGAETESYGSPPGIRSEIGEATGPGLVAPWPTSRPAADGEWLVTYLLAVEEMVATDLGASRARVALRSLLARLGLSQDDAGRMLGVSGETVRRWERGSIRIPANREAEILAAEAALYRLLELFRPERLAAAIRRPADLFAGDTAYDWILRGRIDAVADRYETALAYQG